MRNSRVRRNALQSLQCCAKNLQQTARTEDASCTLCWRLGPTVQKPSLLGDRAFGTSTFLRKSTVADMREAGTQVVTLLACSCQVPRNTNMNAMTACWTA